MPFSSPFINTEYETVVTNIIIRKIHLSWKPNLCIIASKYAHSTPLYALLMSNLIVISLFFSFPPLIYTVHYFKCHKDIVCDLSPWNKCALAIANNFWEDSLQPISKHFGYNFIYNVTQANWPKFYYLLGAFNFGDQTNICIIEPIQHNTCSKNLEDTLNNLRTNNIPISLIKYR